MLSLVKQMTHCLFGLIFGYILILKAVSSLNSLNLKESHQKMMLFHGKQRVFTSSINPKMGPPSIVSAADVPFTTIFRRCLYLFVILTRLLSEKWSYGKHVFCIIYVWTKCM